MDAKTQTTTTTVITPVRDMPVQTVKADTLASILKDKGGTPSFLSFDSVQDMAELDNKGQPKRMKKTGNPFLASGLLKFSKTQATVNWSDTKKKTESRGGEFSGKGSWHTVVIIGGEVTPLSVHKGDIETYLPDDAEKDSISNRRAVVKNGSLVYTAEKPRFYLRYEIVRGHKADSTSRADRPMRSESHYQTPEGVLVDKTEVEPHLKKRSPRIDETDIQVTCIGNIEGLRIDGERFEII
jgi:hypothetical protein